MKSSDATTTVILGATGGVGSNLARRLADRQLPLMLVGRDPERLEALGNELGAPWRSLDARDVQAVEDACKEAGTQLGPVGGIANCVGSLLLKPAHRTSPEEWADTLRTTSTLRLPPCAPPAS